MEIESRLNQMVFLYICIAHDLLNKSSVIAASLNYVQVFVFNLPKPHRNLTILHLKNLITIHNSVLRL